jgi:hypothetical protein
MSTCEASTCAAPNSLEVATYTEDLLGAGLSSKKRQDTSSAAYIQYDLVLEQVLAVQDGAAIALRANLILDHFLVNS